MTIEIIDILKCKNKDELFNIMHQAAFNANCEITESLGFEEQAEFFIDESLKFGSDKNESKEKMSKLANLLLHAESKLAELNEK